MMQKLTDAIQKGMAYLSSEQLPDGGFHSFSSPTTSPFKPAITYLTTFTPALILAAINSVDDTTAQDMRRKLAVWLLTQRSPAWSFNYWATDAPERKQLPYPDDLDDTFCALIALRQHDPSLVDQACLANVVKLLIAAESQVGGPYRTWLVAQDSPKVWQDVDLAVNANIASFLRLVADPLPNITELLEKAIDTNSFQSPYYPSPYPIMYYIARAYNGPRATNLADKVMRLSHDDWWDNPLYTALAVSSLVRLGRADVCRAAVQRLIASQQPSGSWPPEAFCIDPSVQNKTHYSGAAALTTAFAVEALALYEAAIRPPKKNSKPVHASDPAAQELQSRITATVLTETNDLHATLRIRTRATLQQTIQQDEKHEITLLPYFFSRSLAQPLPDNAPDLLVDLGAANTYGWTAYTIYDDFLDEEGDPKLLSVANTALRYSLLHFRRALPDDTAFQELVNYTFNVIDSANAWELAHCRMHVTAKTITIGKPPAYRTTLTLANRSLGHTLTPLGVLAAAGIPPDDTRAQAVTLALRHYIAARQLNDDLHDWEQDLRAGIITYVVARLLQELNVPPRTHAFASLIPKLQKQFWYHTLPAVCATITHHTTLTRRAAHASGLLTQHNIVTQLAEKIDLSVQKTLTERNDAEAFLAAYTS